MRAVLLAMATVTTRAGLRLAEFGMVVHRGVGNVPKLIDLIDDPASGLPPEAKSVLDVLTQALKSLGAKISELDQEISRRAKADGRAKRQMTIPGVGSIVATAMVALAPAPETFRRGRDFAAWVGHTPLQHSSGGKEQLGRTSKMGECTLRRHLIIGASSAAKAASALALEDLHGRLQDGERLVVGPDGALRIAVPRRMQLRGGHTWTTSEPVVSGKPKPDAVLVDGLRRAHALAACDDTARHSPYEARAATAGVPRARSAARHP